MIENFIYCERFQKKLPIGTCVALKNIKRNFFIKSFNEGCFIKNNHVFSPVTCLGLQLWQPWWGEGVGLAVKNLP